MLETLYTRLLAPFYPNVFLGTPPPTIVFLFFFAFPFSVRVVPLLTLSPPTNSEFGTWDFDWGEVSLNSVEGAKICGGSQKTPNYFKIGLFLLP